jgi:dethiobiotin synthetase
LIDMAQPRQLIVVAGTGTEVGKTWAGCELLQQARARGLRVAARKPAQSFSSADGSTDAELLGSASGETSHDVCPQHRWYAVPMAPPMAADVLGLAQLRIDELLEEITWPQGTDLALVETAGGVRAPIAHDADNVDLIRRLGPHKVLLVADAGLGTLNAVRLSLEALAGERVIVLLNRFDAGNELHRRNHDWLAQRDHACVITSVEGWWTATGA